MPTKEIVINTCYGAFNLSRAAIEELIKVKSELIEILSYEEYFGKDADPSHIRNLVKLQESPWGGGVLFRDGLVFRFTGYTKRDHKDLIDMIKKLGPEVASGNLSELKIVEIPAEVDFLVEGYDGNEWVAERHRTWR